ncbi:MAG: YfiR family protein [Sorangiineae bacterium PRO1]|nr:YfiR family protein [Sorangiineae bacterium PRO1]
MRGVRLSRRALISGVVGATAALGLPGAARADEVTVPVPLQIELLAKVAAYDKNLPARAGSKARVVVLSKSKDGDSERIAEQAKKELQKKDTIAGLPAEVTSLGYSDAKDLVKHIKSKHIAVVYLAPGFSGGELGTLAKALEGVSVLTVGAVPKQVAGGVVLGFDLVGGKPKLLVHLKQAKKQDVELSSKVLKLVKVVG